MGLGNLFRSKSEREKELKKKRRKAFRDAENAVAIVKQRVDQLIAERNKAWSEAREYLKAGQKAAARRALKSVRATELMIDQVEKKRWVFDQLLTRLELSKTDQEFSQALGAINSVIEIDPETVADVLDEVQDRLGEQLDVDQGWDKMYDREMAGVEQVSDSVLAVDEMMEHLEGEVVAEVRGRKIAQSEAVLESSVAEEIGEGREKLKRLLEDDK